MVSKKKVDEARALYELYGEEAAEKMGVSLTSFKRYLRGFNRELPGRPNVLLLDIETAPIIANAWSTWKVNIHPDQIIADWFIISWSAKWLFEDKMLGDIVTPEEAINRDDKRIMQSLWEYIDHADVIMGHNVQDFDLKKINTRFLFHEMPPPLPYKVIDTLKVIRRNFGITSNKLAYVNPFLGLTEKLETGGFLLWKACVAGDQEALDHMFEYNNQDVGILEELYVKIRPWVKSHPNMGMFVETDKPCCPNCGNPNLEYGGFYYANVNKYQTFRCLECGAIGRSRKANQGSPKMLISIAN